MTLIGLEYLKHQETKRSNQAKETIDYTKIQSNENIAALDRSSRESIAAQDRVSRENIADKDRASRFAIASLDRDSREAIASADRSSRETIAEADRNSRERVANYQVTTQENIAYEDRKARVGLSTDNIAGYQTWQDMYGTEAIAAGDKRQINTRRLGAGIGTVNSGGGAAGSVAKIISLFV